MGPSYFVIKVWLIDDFMLLFDISLLLLLVVLIASLQLPVKQKLTSSSSLDN